ncbi:hypothetical protein GXW79_19895, partial [Roseomonas arctica]|nr:hypothetical protein [Plastoroseomonas arctica]
MVRRFALVVAGLIAVSPAFAQQQPEWFVPGGQRPPGAPGGQPAGQRPPQGTQPP